MTQKDEGVASQIRLFQLCPVCGGNDLTKTSIMLPEGLLQKCSSCGQFLSSCTREQHENALLKWNVADGTNPNPRSVERYRKVSGRRLTTAIKLLNTESHPLQLLDVGCSSGALLAVAENMGMEVFGVEPASAAAATAQRAGFDVYAGYLHEACLPSEKFDIVTLFEIVEHLSDPIELIAECSRVLKPGGILAVNTPNAASWTAKFMSERWEGFCLIRLGGHASFFTPKSMNSLAQICGLQIARIETRNVRFYERGQCHAAILRLAKVAAQLLAFPARFFGRGHDLLVFIRKEKL